MKNKIGQPDSFIDKKFGRLIVRSIFNFKKKIFICECECGNIKEYSIYNLIHGRTTSCGCYNREKQIKHGYFGSSIYNIWSGIVQRCTNPNSTAYKHYGGRGITICHEWLSPQTFIEWALKNGYNKGLDIDRRDNNKNYNPENCRFVTKLVNCRNRSSTRFHTYNGATKLLIDWARDLNLSYSLISYRIYMGWDIKKAIETPKRQKTA